MSAPVKNNSRNDLLNSKTTHFGNLEHDLLGKTPLPVRTRTHIKGTALISSALKQQSLLLSESGHAVPTLQCLHAGWFSWKCAIKRLQQQNHGTTSPFTPANEGYNERWLRSKEESTYRLPVCRCHVVSVDLFPPVRERENPNRSPN